MSDEQIVDGWLVELVDGEPSPIVDLRTLPGFVGLREHLAGTEREQPRYGSGELRRLAQVLADMPAPRGDQPREMEFAVRIPRVGEVVIGSLLWESSGLEWVWRVEQPREVDPTRIPWQPRPDQSGPDGILVDRRRLR